jgi:ADP-ribose pyrophosphatase
LTPADDDDRRARRRRAYADLRGNRPDLFVNPPDSAYTIELDAVAQETVTARQRRWMRDAGLPAEYGDVGVVYQDEYLTIVRDAVRFRDGRLGSYVRIVPAARLGAGGSVVLPLVDGGVMLARHFRHATRTWSWEAPRGFPESGEEPADTAARELTEELGLVPVELSYLGPIYPDTGLSCSAMHVFAARATGDQNTGDQITGDQATAGPGADRLEGIDEIRRLSPAELDLWIADGLISDAPSLAAIALARSRGLLS